MLRLPMDAAAALEAFAEHVRCGSEIRAIDFDDAPAAVERDLTAHGSFDDEAGRGRLALYRELVVAVNRLDPGERRMSRT